MRHDQTVIINIPLAFNCQTPLQHQLRLVRYTAQLRTLLDSPPRICDECSIDALESDILDNYLWAVGELINGMFQLKNCIQKEQEEFINNRELFTGSPL